MDIKNEVKSYQSFDDMGLKSQLLKGIYSYGFEKPSSIQKKAIVPIINNNDIIAQSQSGTGKTGAFTIGLLELIDSSKDETQGLILAPTRELATQIYSVIKNISSYIEDIKIRLSIGGTRNREYNKWIEEKKDHIIIGTAGRVLDNIKRKKMDVGDLKLLVLDEADEMLSKGFLDQIHSIIREIPSKTKVALFSATLPPEVLDLSQKIITNPINIMVKKEELTLEGIKQFYVAVEKKAYKIDTLIDLYETISVTQCIIFINRKRDAEYVYDELKKNNFGVDIITGNMEQDERNNVIKQFRAGTSRILITTGLLSRGFDVQQISLVINFDLPIDKESYIHSSGRCGRWGRKGCVINFVTKSEYYNMKKIEQYYNTVIEELPMNVADYIN